VPTFRLFHDILTDCLSERPFAIVDGPSNAPAGQHEATKPGNRALIRRDRRRQKRKDTRKRKALQERSRQPGHDCLCPRCPRYFNKRGAIFHLYVPHSNNSNNIAFSRTSPGEALTVTPCQTRRQNLCLNLTSKSFAPNSYCWYPSNACHSPAHSYQNPLSLSALSGYISERHSVHRPAQLRRVSPFARSRRRSSAAWWRRGSLFFSMA
jgi:hypothetical protein